MRDSDALLHRLLALENEWCGVVHAGPASAVHTPLAGQRKGRYTRYDQTHVDMLDAGALAEVLQAVCLPAWAFAL